MRHRLWILTTLLVAACGGAGDRARETADSGGNAGPDPSPRVLLATSLGPIVLELARDSAPQTVANFLRHVRGGFYDGLTFHRVREGFMIQAGALTAGRERRTSPVFPIANEAPTGLDNVRGAVAMARTSDPHSATSEFFINLVDNPALDFRDSTAAGWGYAVFGRVVEGMEVVDSIAKVPVSRVGRYEALPDTPVVIDSARVIE